MKCHESMFIRVVRNECECVNECEKMHPGKMNHNFCSMGSFSKNKCNEGTFY